MIILAGWKSKLTPATCCARVMMFEITNFQISQTNDNC